MKLTASTYESYIQQGSKHVAKASWKYVTKSKKDVLCHTRFTRKIFSVGETHREKNQNSVHKTLHEDICIVPDLTLLQKDHKPVDLETGLPSTRPLFEASCTINQRASWRLTTVLQGTTKADKTHEETYTEDMISKVDRVNRSIQEGRISPRNLMVGSLDFCTLYPSINTRIAGKICRDRVGRSNIKFKGINYK